MEHEVRSDWDARELECFLILCQELHFGATARRMHLTQSRVSQLVRGLERRVGGALFERTSRRVVVTPLGEELRGEVGPLYRAIGASVDRARDRARRARAVRIGFVGPLSDHLLSATRRFLRGDPRWRIDFDELPLHDPFGPVLRGEVDAAFICAPVDDPDLVAGPVLVREGCVLAVSRDHRLAGRDEVDIEELAGHTMVGIDPPAPAAWRHAASPRHTPEGRPIPEGAAVSTLAEAFVAIAARRGAMIFPARMSRHQQRHDVVYVPLAGVPESTISLVWRKGHDSAAVRALADSTAATALGAVS